MSGAAAPRRSLIVLVDDHPVVRRGLRELLEHEPDFCVCGEADCFAQASEVLRTTQPSVAIIDLALPDGDGMELIRRIRQRDPSIKLIVVSSRHAGTYAPLAQAAGADGFVPKHEATDRIVDVVRCVLAGKRCFLGTCGCESSHWLG